MIGDRFKQPSQTDEQIIEESYIKFRKVLGEQVLAWAPMFGMKPEDYKVEIRRVIELVKQRERNAK